MSGANPTPRHKNRGTNSIGYRIGVMFGGSKLKKDHRIRVNLNSKIRNYKFNRELISGKKSKIRE